MYTLGIGAAASRRLNSLDSKSSISHADEKVTRTTSYIQQSSALREA